MPFRSSSLLRPTRYCSFMRLLYAPLDRLFLPSMPPSFPHTFSSPHVTSFCSCRSIPSYLLTLVSDSSSSDGHTDSAFGESIVSSSSVSTPVGGLSSNRFNPMSSTTVNHDADAGNDFVSQQSSSSNLLESTPVNVQEAREDEEAGYARLEDIRSAQESKEKPRYCFGICACFASLWQPCSLVALSTFEWECVQLIILRANSKRNNPIFARWSRYQIDFRIPLGSRMLGKLQNNDVTSSLCRAFLQNNKWKLWLLALNPGLGLFLE